MRYLVPPPAVIAALVGLAATACSSAMPAPASGSAATSSGTTTLLVRLGSDTVAMEQYTRTATRVDGVLIARAPVATISRYSVQLDGNSAPTSAEYSVRRGDGSMVAGSMESLSMRYARDSVMLVGRRAAGDTMRTNLARGMVLPYLNSAYGLFEVALARLLATGRDSAEFTIVPMSFNVRNTTPVAIKRYAGDSVRVNWFGSPLYARHDGRGGLLGLDGRQTTFKARVDRVAAVDLEALVRSWHLAGTMGAPSTRDTVNATVGDARIWIDYGRPALRGRNVWVNGVLGDTLWRTGANAATQLRTDKEIVIGGATVPAGTYTLFTRASPAGQYQLVINRQVGQWGTEYHADRDLARVTLTESNGRASAERFTIGVAPEGARSGMLAMAWGTKVLSVPVTSR